MLFLVETGKFKKELYTVLFIQQNIKKCIASKYAIRETHKILRKEILNFDENTTSLPVRTGRNEPGTQLHKQEETFQVYLR